MKKTFVFVLSLLLCLSFVHAVSITESSVSSDPPAYPSSLSIIDGEIQDISTTRFFSFVDLEVKDLVSYSCSLQKTAGNYGWDGSADIKIGGQCPLNSFILYRFEDGSRNGNVLFDNLWLRKSSGDLPRIANYYLADIGPFTYSYGCFSCPVQVDDDFEHGCLTKDKTACVKRSDSRCDIWYEYESQCLQHIDTSGDGNAGGSDVVVNDDSGSGGSASTGSSSGSTSSSTLGTLSISNMRVEEIDDAQDGILDFGRTFKITVDVAASQSGDYWLEAGSTTPGLSFVDVDENTCNPTELWFNNKLVSLSQGDNTVSFSIVPKPGVNNYWVAQVTGCGGNVVTRLDATNTIAVRNAEGQFRPEPGSSDDLQLNYTYVAIAVILFVGGYLFFRKK